MGHYFMSNKIFISYSHKDAIVANAICNSLENDGIECWIAPRNILPGVKWAHAINGAIKEAKALILVFSENSNMSDQVLREIELAIGNKLIIIPVKIEDISPTESMEYYLSTLQWITLRGKLTDSKLEEFNEKISNALKGNGIGAEKKSWLKPVLIASSIMILTLIAIGFIFKDSIFSLKGEKNDLNNSTEQTLNVDTSELQNISPNITDEITNTPAPSEDMQEKPQENFMYWYIEENDKLFFQVYTKYSKAAVYIGNLEVEAEVLNTIHFLQIEIDMEQIEKNSINSMSIELYGKEWEGIEKIYLNGFYFCDSDTAFSEISQIENLQYLYFAGNQVKGDIADLGPLKNIKRLDFMNCPNVVGDISVISNFKDMMGFALVGCENVTGNINVFEEMSNLSGIDISVSNLTGNLSSVANNKKLSSLCIADCINIEGDISDFNNLQFLKVIQLTNLPKLTGDIGNIEGWDRAKLIFIIECLGIEGDVASLARFSNITRIYITQAPKLYGDIEPLGVLENLSNLAFIECPNVKGKLTLITGETISLN